jgi:hypothetical protein
MKMKTKDEKYQKRFGLIFLIGFSVFGAFLNYINFLDKLSTYLTQAIQTIPIVVIIHWSVFLLIFVPIYWMFYHSVRKWDWSLDEWGFGLKKKAWIGIGLSIIVILIIVFQMQKQKTAMVTDSSHFSIFFIISYARVAEELMYRGFALILLRRLFKKYKYGTLYAIFLSSALFTIVHTHKLESALSQYVGGSLLITVITALTGSISFAIIYHAIAGGGLISGFIAALFFISMVLINLKRKKSASSKIQPDSPSMAPDFSDGVCEKPVP